MTIPRARFTYEEYLNLPDDQRYEVLEGKLVMAPAPNIDHQDIVFALSYLLGAYNRERRVGKFLSAPCDVILSQHNVVQPDLLFVSQERRSIIEQRGIFGAPDLVVEILSPSTAERHLQAKRELYGRYGVREYWIIDPQARSVEVLTQQGVGLETWQRYEGEGALQSPLLTGLVVNLAELFEE